VSCTPERDPLVKQNGVTDSNPRDRLGRPSSVTRCSCRGSVVPLREPISERRLDVRDGPSLRPARDTGCFRGRRSAATVRGSPNRSLARFHRVPGSGTLRLSRDVAGDLVRVERLGRQHERLGLGAGASVVSPLRSRDRTSGSTSADTLPCPPDRPALSLTDRVSAR
jgi:hypothetical protein